ncbi:alkaline phosphatase [Desulfovibrio mangrovi]|uniref:alkaline phosphatase n=1 Tax=Desulfovibrio mangrovi TaxID=2976983 RepID=UPI00224674F1|nr:alkaline phosphatase [Desulfovibrio mangrovi]UZP68558.1 alkaline phosphatase [Desulfovibrio mangrovi]
MSTVLLRGYKIFLVACMLLGTMLAGGAAAGGSDYYSGKAAKYVFLFIGDGMGIPQQVATEAFLGKELSMRSFPAQGVTTTPAADRFIVDSAAAATAMSAGQITNVGMIGLAPDKSKVKTIAEMAKERGMKVGIVSSVSIDHATPAAFYAHVPSRSQYHYIDHAIAESGFDYFAGGGLKDPKGKKKGIESRGDAMEAIRNAGFTVVDNREDFLSLSRKSGKVLAYNQWLQDSAALPYAIDQRKDKDISLAEFTRKGIELLDNSKGFFMMVEGGKIDWACHANDAKAAIMDTVAFDEAVREALAFYKKHPEETAIIVTGDHECGGMSLGFAGTKYDTNFDVLKSQCVSFQYFTDDVLKLFKQENKGDVTFEALQPSITHYFGLEFSGDPAKNPLVLKPYEVEALKDAYARSMLEEVVKPDGDSNRLYGGYDPLTVAITHIVNNKAGLAWTSFSHTAVPVMTSALGVGAESFNSSYHQAEIAKKIMAILGNKPHVYLAVK